MKKCPYCAEEIQDEAKLCRYCGRDLQQHREESNNKWPAIFAVAIFLIVLGGIAFVQNRHLEQLSSGFTDPAPGSRDATAQSTASAAVSMANYLKLSEGMSYRDVVAILGKSGTEISRSNIAGISTVMYMWEGSSPGANMNAMFQQDKLVQKAQFGLR